MRGRLKRQIQALGKLFFPDYCYVGGQLFLPEALKHNVSRDLWQQLRPLGDEVCFRCGLPLGSSAPREASPAYYCADCRAARLPFSAMRSQFPYTQPLREIIHLFKFEGFLQIGEELGRQMGEWAAANEALRTARTVTAVPLHPWRKLTRGFNQSEVLARLVAERMGLPYSPACLRRIRNTRPQSRLAAEKRRTNVRGAFTADAGAVAGSRILLIDDVATTETTVRECARALKAAGARDVRVATLARSIV